MLKKRKANGFSVYFKIGFLNFIPYVVGTHWNCLMEAIPKCTYNICPFNKRVFFHHKTGFSQTSQFQCNEHVEMNKFMCSLACTWMIIINSQFYIIDSLSLGVSLE